MKHRQVGYTVAFGLTLLGWHAFSQTSAGGDPVSQGPAISMSQPEASATVAPLKESGADDRRGPTEPVSPPPGTVTAPVPSMAPPASSVGSASSAMPSTSSPDAAEDKRERKKRVGAENADPVDTTDADQNDRRSDQEGKRGKKLPWEANSKIQVGGLLHAQFALNDAPETANNDFRLANARIYLEWRQGSLLDAVGEVELSRDGDRESTAWAPMRDAYVRVSPDPALRFRMGQFKRPFGKLALTPLRELKLIQRGISDVWINEELNYGERDVGFQIEGKYGHGIEIHYALGAFNGRGRNHRDDDPNGAKDFVGRLEGRLGPHFSVAFNAANKRFDQAVHADRPQSVWASGADMLLAYRGLYALVEGLYGQNYESSADRHSASLLGLVAYKIPIADFWQIAIEPLVKGEILRPEAEVKDRHILNGTAGANLYLGRIFRLMVQGEWIAPKGPLPEHLAEGAEQKRLIIQAGMYTR